MRHLGTFLLGAALLTGCEKNSPSSKSSNATPPPSDVAKKNSEAMRDLREMMLATPATKLGIQKTDDFPRTYGALMDWPLGDGNIISVVGLCDGNASLYTTSTFGIIGGGAHESVRKAAANFVRVADNFYADAVPTSDHSFPTGNRVKFFLVTFDGVRVIDVDFDSVASGKDKFSELFVEGQRLVTEIRLIMNKQPK
jgi:hypothetical protein